MRSKVLRTVCILACLAMLLSVFVGCGAMRKEVTVIFSSADYSSPEAVCKLSRYNEVIVPGLSDDFKLGHAFRGWSFEKDSDTVDIKTGDLIRYGDIEGHIKENVVNMYPVWVAGPELVIGWDAREDLSGLNEKIIENFQAALNKFVQELNVGELNVVVRRYWAETTPEIGVMIRNDADVDVLLGFGDNISSSTEAGGGSGGGGVPTVELKGNVPMGGKTRYIGRCNDNWLSRQAYDWLQTKAARESLQVVFEADKEDPATRSEIVIVWEARENISGLTQDKMDYFKQQLEADLAANGFENPKVTIRSYPDITETAQLGEKIRADGDVDLALCVGDNFIKASGANMAEETLQFSSKYTINGKSGRYFARLTNREISIYVMNLLTSAAQYRKWLEGDPVQEEPPVEQSKLVIVWDARESISGLTETDIAYFKQKLEAKLTESGFKDFTVEMRHYDITETAQLGEKIKADGDVDLVLCVGDNFIKSTGADMKNETKEFSSKYTVGGVKNRYFARLTDGELSVFVMNLLCGEDSEARDWLAGEPTAAASAQELRAAIVSRF